MACCKAGKEITMAESFSNSLISNTIFHLLNFERYPSFQVALKEAAINNDFQLMYPHRQTCSLVLNQWNFKIQSRIG